MTTVMLWLLISIGENSVYSRTGFPTQVVERFVTVEECERVRKLVQESNSRAALRCIQTTVVKTW